MCFKSTMRYFDRFRVLKLNRVLLKTSSNEDGGLIPTVDKAKRLFPFPHFTAIPMAMPIVSGLPYYWDTYSHRTTELGENRKWKIQDGGLHSWNVYISVPRLASNVNTTASLLFSDSAIPMGHVSITYDWTGRKPEVESPEYRHHEFTTFG